MKLWLTQEQFTQHIQVIGATGTRKSSLLRRLVRQVIAKGWPCIFLDLKKEYLQEFYRPGVDYLIDFTDERCCRWMLGQEAVDEPHGMVMAEGAFPDEQHKSFFFQDHAKSIATFLFAGDHERRHLVSTSNMAKWLARSSVIDRLVRHTEHRVTLTKNAAEQRAGIFGTLNHLGRSMRWMPDDVGRQEFAVRRWARDRVGHIFLSSTAATFPALRPLQSLIFDMVLQHLQEVPGPPVLVVGDEVGRFQRSPQLENAVTMQRSTGCPIVLAYQGFSQLESIYGEKVAESIMTNPYTNIVLRTQSQRSAEASSYLLGMPSELERERKTTTQHGFLLRYTNEGTNEEIPLRSAVLPSEIQTKKPGRGWMSQAGKIVEVNIPYLAAKILQPKSIPRPMSEKYKMSMLLAAREMEIESLRRRAKELGFNLVDTSFTESADEIDQDALIEETNRHFRAHRNQYASQ